MGLLTNPIHWNGGVVGYMMKRIVLMLMQVALLHDKQTEYHGWSRWLFHFWKVGHT